MTDAKPEAPAEGAGEARDRLIEVLKRMDDGVYASLNDQADAVISALILQPKDPAEVGAEVASAARALLDACYKADENSDLSDFVDGMLLTRLDKALRARSSAPEAREEALGNLLAVIHGDGGHRALEVGVEQAAAEAEKIVANLLSSAPEAREGEAVAWDHAVRYLDNPWKLASDFPPDFFEEIQSDPKWKVQPLYTHPAAPSSDKLRIAVEAAFVAGATSVHEYWTENPGEAPNGDPEFDEAANDYALATLKAEGA